MQLADRIEQKIKATRPEQALKSLLVAPVWLVGWLAGRLVRGVQWILAALAIGYKDGVGE